MTKISFVDSPIHDLKQDILNRKSFCQHVSTAVKTWKGDNSLVIAICGDWGSGKTSIKNLIVNNFLENNDSIIHLEFNPWHWSSNENIHSMFFKELDKKLSSSKIYSSEKEMKVLSEYITYYSYGDSIDDLIKLPAIISLSISGGIATLFMFDVSVYIKIIATLCLGVLLYLTSIKTVKLYFLRKYSLASSKSNRTLEEIKSELNSCMKASKFKIVVTIDDLDRLTEDEVKSIFQILKVNADFSNMVYLCFFQRSVIEEIIQKEYPKAHGNYLEKIFQTTLNIPLPWKESVDRYFLSQIKEIIDDYLLDNYEENELKQIYLEGMHQYFPNLRSIKRYISSLRFHVGCFVKNGFLEVNFLDLCLLEVLRIFEPEIYKELSKNSYIYSKDGYTNSLKKDIEMFYKTLVEQYSNNKIATIKILKHLFPLHKSYFDSIQVNDSAIYTIVLDRSGMKLADLRRDYRICHPDIFTRYFILDSIPGELQKSYIKYIIDNISNKDILHDSLSDLRKNNQLESMLNYIYSYVKTIDSSSMILLLESLYIFVNKNYIEENKENLIETIINIIMQKIYNLRNTERKDFIAEVYSVLDNDIYYSVRFTDVILNSSEIINSLNRNQIKEFMERIVSKIQIYSKKTDFMDNKYCIMYLAMWHRLKNDEDFADAVNSLLESREGIFKFMQTSIIVSHRNIGGVIRKVYQLDRNLLQFMIPENIIHYWDKLAIADENKMEKLYLTIFEKEEVWEGDENYKLIFS